MSEAATPKLVGDPAAPRKRDLAAQAVGDVADAATAMPRGVASALAARPRDVMRDVWGFTRDPSKGIDAIAAFAAHDNRLINNWAMVSKQVAAPPTPPAITGEVGKEKTLSWITGITVAQITELHQQYNASFNDVLVAVLSGGLGNYLRSRGDDTTDVPVMLAVALKPMDLDSPEEAGNFAAMVSLTLPVGIEDPRERVAEVAHRMNRMKNSDEALLVIGLMNAVAATPDIVRAGLTKQVANTHSAVVTNVPGPAQPMNLAGVEVAGLVGHNPARAKQPMTGRCSATTATSRSAS